MILRTIKVHKDITLMELVALLTHEHGASFAPSTVHRFLVRHRITLKKTVHTAEQDRPDVARRRQAWFDAQPDRHLQTISDHGRMGWQKVSGYSWRALVEADITRFKRVIGDMLRSRTDRRRATEIAIAVDALNRMLGLGRSAYVRLA